MNIQEEFNFLVRNLSEKNEEQGSSTEIIARYRRALSNVINSFMTDFDKMSQKQDNLNKMHLPPIFTMISLYIEKYTELFICQTPVGSTEMRSVKHSSFKLNQKNVEQDLLISRQKIKSSA